MEGKGAKKEIKDALKPHIKRKKYENAPV